MSHKTSFPVEVMVIPIVHPDFLDILRDFREKSHYGYTSLQMEVYIIQIGGKITQIINLTENRLWY